MAVYSVSLSFAQLSDSNLDEFTQNIIERLNANPNFPTPPVTIPELTSALDDFTAAMVAAAQGGKQATAAKNAAREALLALLRQEADFVQLKANGDLVKLLSSGFDAKSTNRTRSPLGKPNIVQIDNDASAQLTVRVTPIANAHAYEVRVSYGPNGWQSAGVFTQARRIVLSDLTPGTTYTVQARAVGGTTGYSDWSDPVSHMAL